MHRKNVIRNAAEIGRAQALIAFQQQAGADEKDDRKTHFQCEQPFAHLDL
jgi:hypothetical protein